MWSGLYRDRTQTSSGMVRPTSTDSLHVLDDGGTVGAVSDRRGMVRSGGLSVLLHDQFGHALTSDRTPFGDLLMDGVSDVDGDGVDLFLLLALVPLDDVVAQEVE